MFWRALYTSSLLLFTLILPSCVVPADQSFSGTNRPPSGYNVQSAYEQGQKEGREDRRMGYPFNAKGRSLKYLPALRQNYVRGYTAGFKNQPSPPPRPVKPQSTAAQSKAAYEKGYRSGRQDRLSGHSQQPTLYKDSVPSELYRDFRQGYSAGWDSAASKWLR